MNVGVHRVDELNASHADAVGPGNKTVAVASDVLPGGRVVGIASGVLARTDGDGFDCAVPKTERDLIVFGWAAGHRPTGSVVGFIETGSPHHGRRSAKTAILFAQRLHHRRSLYRSRCPGGNGIGPIAC